ncbi:MAG: peptidoglycan-associated lipoprotein Pal [Candidatus Pelagibacter sp.]
MNLNKILNNLFLVVLLSLIVTACATKKSVKTTEASTSTSTAAETQKADPIEKLDALMQGDVYIGSDTVGELASGVPDRVFFATNETILTTASRETLRKQAAWLRQNPDVTVVVEGHADERGTREYNLALGERRANAAKDYLMTYGVSSDRIKVLSYGKERPVDSGSNPLSWSKNRRSVTVKAN